MVLRYNFFSILLWILLIALFHQAFYRVRNHWILLPLFFFLKELRIIDILEDLLDRLSVLICLLVPQFIKVFLYDLLNFHFETINFWLYWLFCLDLGDVICIFFQKFHVGFDVISVDLVIRKSLKSATIHPEILECKYDSEMR